MHSFHRLFSVFALLGSLVLLSAARPTHHGALLRSRTNSDDVVAQFEKLRLDMKSATDDLNKAATTGENPKSQIDNIVALLSFPALQMDKSKIQPTPEQRAEMIESVADITTMISSTSHAVGLKANFQRWYPLWTDEDVAMQSFYDKKVPFEVLKPALIKAGSGVCGQFHDLRMRHTVNMMGGMGVGYN
ncbi:hypothetical protein FRC07_004165 [Ceratobasidium sp. 392]|nr:hypothetical protein FRC07_004165 [Ceratobasidium sp. 392]